MSPSWRFSCELCAHLPSISKLLTRAPIKASSWSCRSITTPLRLSFCFSGSRSALSSASNRPTHSRSRTRSLLLRAVHRRASGRANSDAIHHHAIERFRVGFFERGVGGFELDVDEDLINLGHSQGARPRSGFFSYTPLLLLHDGGRYGAECLTSRRQKLNRCRPRVEAPIL